MEAVAIYSGGKKKKNHYEINLFFHLQERLKPLPLRLEKRMAVPSFQISSLSST